MARVSHSPLVLVCLLLVVATLLDPSALQRAHAVRVLVVTTTSDEIVPDTSAPLVCPVDSFSLRCALTQVNIDGSGDTITFNIPTSGPNADPGCHAETIQGQSVSVCVLRPHWSMPKITAGSLTVDGYSQPGSLPNTNKPGLGVPNTAILTIQIDGTNSMQEAKDHALPINHGGGPADTAWVFTEQAPFWVESDEGNDDFRGLSFTNWCICHPQFGAGNTIAGVGDDSHIDGNFFGVAPDGTLGMNGGFGASGGVLFGGPTPAEANLVTGFYNMGVYAAVDATSQRSPTIEGNFIGQLPDGSAPPLGDKGRYSSVFLSLGVAATVRSNVIAYSDSRAIWNGSNLPSTVEDNTIAFSRDAGIFINYWCTTLDVSIAPMA